MERIDDPKIVMKAAQAVWAANKYFVLACSQHRYQEMAKHLQTDRKDLRAAFQTIKTTEEQYHDLKGEKLPQIKNALYHMAGYFKEYSSSIDRKQMAQSIEEDPAQAIVELERLANVHQVDYLLRTRLWATTRATAFNLVPIVLHNQEQKLEPYTLYWEGDYLLFKN